jgi:hypothetical protein
VPSKYAKDVHLSLKMLKGKVHHREQHHGFLKSSMAYTTMMPLFPAYQQYATIMMLCFGHINDLTFMHTPREETHPLHHTQLTFAKYQNNECI